MTLQKQLAHINITGNVERKDDGFLVIPSKLTRADDVVWDDASTPLVRGGQSLQALTIDSVSVESVGEAKRLIVNKGSLFIESSNGVHGIHSAGARQIRPASSLAAPRAFQRAGMTTRRLASVLPKASVGGAGTPYYANNYDAVTNSNGVTCAAFETLDASTSISTVRFIVTEADDTPLADFQLNTLSSKARVKPRVVWTGTKFFVYYGTFTVGGASFEIRRVGLSSTGAVSDAEAVVVTSSASAGVIEQTNYEVLFDVAITGTTLGLVYRNVNAAYNVYLIRLSATDGSTISDTANVVPSAMPTSLTCLSYISGAAVEIIHALFSTGGTTVRGIYRVVGSATSAEVVVATGAAASVTGRIVAYTNDDLTITVAYDSQEATLTASTLRLSNITQGHVVNSECPAFQSLWRIAGRIGVVGSRLYLPMCYYSTETVAENTFYVIDLTSALRNLGTATNSEPPDVVARIDYGEGGVFRSDWRAESRVPGVSVVGNVLYVAYLKLETDLVLVGGNNATSKAMALAVIDFDSQLRDVEVGGNTLLASACPRLFDGRSMVEEGFHHAPYYVPSTAAAVAGPTPYGPFPAGTCTVCFTVGWQDDQGNWHESAPSNAIETTFVSPGTRYLNPTVYLPPSLKVGTVLRIWRTQASSTDTTLYLTRTPQGYFESVDASLAASEALYTTGDILPNEPMPACRHLSLYQGRVVASGTGDGSGVAWSKETERGYGVEFCSSDPLHRLRVPSSLGRAVGAQEVDDRLFILCERGVGIIYGTGPSATGLAGGYSDFNTIITETGCDRDSPKSIARAPEGIWFRSPFGIRLISRAGGLARGQDGKQVGAEMDEYVGGKCTAVFGDAKQQIRFYQVDPGNVLVWDYQWQRWSRFTSHANVDAVFADDRYYHVNNVSSVAQIRYYDETAIRDVGNTGLTGQVFTGTTETAWLQFAGIQGFQRIYRLMVLGKNTTTQPVTIVGSFFYDFSSTADSDVMTAAPITPGAGGVVQVQHHMVRQKCEALKIRIEMTANATVPATSGRFRLTDLTLQVGVKSGYNKLPSSQRF